MRRKNNYAMMKLNVPKRVNLPNGRTFVACYKRIPIDQLSPNVVMIRTYTQRAALRGRRLRRAQQGQGVFDFVKKVARNLLVKLIVRKGLEYAPVVYQNLTKRVKNKTLKRILNSDAAHLTLSKAIKTSNNLFMMNKGLSNFQIDDFFKDEENEDFKKIIWVHIK